MESIAARRTRGEANTERADSDCDCSCDDGAVGGAGIGAACIIVAGVVAILVLMLVLMLGLVSLLRISHSRLILDSAIAIAAAELDSEELELGGAMMTDTELHWFDDPVKSFSKCQPSQKDPCTLIRFTHYYSCFTSLETRVS